MRGRAVFLLIAACHASAPPAPTTGTLQGQVRDQDSGAALANAALAFQRDGTLRPILLASATDGSYQLARLRPGRYDVTATYAGVTVDVRGVELVAGRTLDVDVDLPLGRAELHHLDFGDPRDGELRFYRPRGADPRVGGIEGTLADAVTRERIVGAVITATSPALTEAAQVVTDDHGRFALRDLPPGPYSVSAYYTITRHATIQVEHNRVPVRGGEAAVVPLFVETTP